MSLKAEKNGLGLGIKTFSGISGATYLVFKTAEGTFHAYKEVDANEAARDCGAEVVGSTEDSPRSLWEKVWDKIGIFT